MASPCRGLTRILKGPTVQMLPSCAVLVFLSKLAPICPLLTHTSLIVGHIFVYSLPENRRVYRVEGGATSWAGQHRFIFRLKKDDAMQNLMSWAEILTHLCQDAKFLDGYEER